MALLDDARLEVRERAAQLLHFLTAEGFDYDPAAAAAERTHAAAAWRDWWESDGRHLPWNYESRGATFGATVRPAPPSRRSARLGGVAYPLTALSAAHHDRVVAALERFAKSGSSDALDGQQRVADHQITYPARPARAHCDASLTAALQAAVGRLTSDASQGKVRVTEGRMLLATIRSFACTELGPPLRQFGYATEQSPGWEPLRGALSTALDLQSLP